jgi:Uridine phosphorylase
MSYTTNKLTNKEGKMYHIGLGDGEIAPNVLLPGDPGRCETIAKCFDEAVYLTSHREYLSYNGKYKDVPVAVMSTGMGCPSVAIGIEELKHLDCKNLIRVGTCGGWGYDIKPGSIVIVTGAVRGEGTSLEYVPVEFPAIANIDVVCAMREAAKELGIPAELGLTRSHDAFYRESPGVQDLVEKRIRPWAEAGVKVVENESSTLFIVSELLDMRAGTILVVLDNIWTGEEIDYDSDLPPLVEKATQIALNAFVKLGALEK